MEPNARFRSNVRTFYAWVGSLVVFAAAPFLAVRLIDYGTVWLIALFGAKLHFERSR